MNTVSTFAPTSHTRGSDWWLTSGRVKHSVLFKPQPVLLTLLDYHRVLGAGEINMSPTKHEGGGGV